MHSASVERLESYLSGRWTRGDAVETELLDPVSGEVLATASSKGLDLKGALEFVHTRVRAGLQALGFAERG